MSPSSAGQAPLPSFLVIGAERSATRWLRFNLDRHPEVFSPPVEINWFSDAEMMRARGRRWYQSQFDAWEGEPVLGESSARYLKLASSPDQVAARIQRSIPDVRLVAILRQPVDRLESAVRMYVKQGRLAADVDVYDLICRNDPIVAELDLIGAGLYASCLYPFLQTFGEQLLVLDHADIGRKPHEVYASVLRHLDADPTFVPPDLDRVRFSDRPTVSVPELGDEQRRIVYTAFRLDVEELEAQIGRDLSAWDPGPPPFDRRAEADAVLAAVPFTGPAPEPGETGPVDDDDDDDDVVDAADVPPITRSAVAP